MANITNIPAPRVPVIDSRTGLMARVWYLYFFNLQNLTGGGGSPVAIDDLLIGPQAQTPISADSAAASNANDVLQQFAELDKNVQALALRPASVADVRPDLVEQLQQQFAELQKDIQALALRPVYEPNDTTHVVAAYGAMSRVTNQTIGAVGATYLTIANYDLDRVTPNLNVTTDIVTGSLSVARPSIYQVAFSMSFTCTSLNVGRNFNLRIYDIDDASQIGDVFPVYVGRDTDGGSTNLVTLFRIPSFYVNTKIVVQLGGADTFSTFVITHVGFSINGAGL